MYHSTTAYITSLELTTFLTSRRKYCDPCRRRGIVRHRIAFSERPLGLRHSPELTSAVSAVGSHQTKRERPLTTMLPPGIIPQRMLACVDSGPMRRAAAACDGLGAERGSTASSLSSMASDLASKSQQGPAVVSMAGAAGRPRGDGCAQRPMASAAAQAKAVTQVLEPYVRRWCIQCWPTPAQSAGLGWLGRMCLVFRLR